MSTTPVTPRNFIKLLSIIHFALCTGIVLFMAFAYWQTGGFNVDAEEGDVFVYVIPVLAMLGYFGSKFIYRNLIQNLPKDEKLQTKLTRYRVASLIQYALIEGPAIIAVLAYAWSGTALYLVIAVSLLAYLFAQRPSLERLFREVPLNFEEKKQFDTLKAE